MFSYFSRPDLQTRVSFSGNDGRHPCCVNSFSFWILYVQYGDNREFLWRLARAYSDMYKSTEDQLEKKTFAEQGNGTHILA